jgi:hypothetical protein
MYFCRCSVDDFAVHACHAGAVWLSGLGRISVMSFCPEFRQPSHFFLGLPICDLLDPKSGLLFLKDSTWRRYFEKVWSF